MLVKQKQAEYSNSAIYMYSILELTNYSGIIGFVPNKSFYFTIIDHRQRLLTYHESMSK